MTASNDTNALFYPFVKGALTRPSVNEGGRGFFINAAPCPFLQEEDTGINMFFQPEFTQAFSLTKAGFPVLSDWPEKAGGDLFDTVLVRLPKQRDQAHYYMARGLELLKEGGIMVCAAANDAGGGRIEKDMRQLLGGAPCFSLSKYKARVVWGEKKSGLLDKDVLEHWRVRGALQKYEGHGFWTQPGIFGWDKVDRGSAMLQEELSGDFDGIGADFGCGYGYLSAGLCRAHKGIKELYCIDSDKNAIKAARRNMEAAAGNAACHYIWDDLTAPVTDFPAFDWIVMNPPFHDGKREDTDIGVEFIKTAAKNLRPKGVLWMVANRQLPYEKTLESLFSSYKNLREENGFKIYCAIKQV